MPAAAKAAAGYAVLLPLLARRRTDMFSLQAWKRTRGGRRHTWDSAHRGEMTRFPLWLAELRRREGWGRLGCHATPFESYALRIVPSLARGRMGEGHGRNGDGVNGKQ